MHKLKRSPCILKTRDKMSYKDGVKKLTLSSESINSFERKKKLLIKRNAQFDIIIH